ncbi:endonuclease/exonuclease/phosphatase family protein [Streptomyces sp. NRRL B-24572]|uniref:endonuclease/exonuclease/phosphatase family protein n=1 Tax=Streptomyces sp. NRRL B-24572 TaxID=1962156 RepID=UPI00211ADB9E|nr:endonuclease/exonuclease/phosphatase family protein [Streptomyces sp. NRRL B-24572]
MDDPLPLRPRHRTAAWAGGLLLIVPAVIAGCRILDTDAVTPVPQLLSLLPWLTVPAALGALLAMTARRRALSLLAVVVLATTAWSALPYMPRLITSYGLPLARVRVLAANIEFGEATGALIDTIRRERPQLVFVSECDRACGHTLTSTFATELPHHASVDADGSAGSVLLSAYPLRDKGIPPARAKPRARGRVIPAAMGMPGATAEIAGLPVRLQLAHPLPPLPGRVDAWKRELGRIATVAAGRPYDEPFLLAGDFNASQDHAAFRAILDRGRLQDAARLARTSRTPTWPTEGPVPPYVQIDHVLVSDDFSVAGIRFPALAGSDHRAVLADLDLRGGR